MMFDEMICLMARCVAGGDIDAIAAPPRAENSNTMSRHDTGEAAPRCQMRHAYPAAVILGRQI